MSRLRERVKRRSRGRTLKDRPDTSEIEPFNKVIGSCSGREKAEETSFEV
jgi:hypothetical protein